MKRYQVTDRATGTAWIVHAGSARVAVTKLLAERLDLFHQTKLKSTQLVGLIVKDLGTVKRYGKWQPPRHERVGTVTYSYKGRYEQLIYLPDSEPVPEGYEPYDKDRQNRGR